MKRFVPQPLIHQCFLQTQRPANRWLLYKLGRRRDRVALFSGCFFHGRFYTPQCQTAPPGQVPTASTSRGWRQPSDGGGRQDLKWQGSVPRALLQPCSSRVAASPAASKPAVRCGGVNPAGCGRGSGQHGHCPTPSLLPPAPTRQTRRASGERDVDLLFGSANQGEHSVVSIS